MRTFQDSKGREWTVEITIATAKRLRDLLDVDLIAAYSDENDDLFQRLSVDPFLLCNVVYVVCKPQADAEGVSDEQFGEAMSGQPIENATEALLEELVVFFPRAKRTTFRKALNRMREMEAKAAAVTEAKLDDPEIERTMIARLERALDESLGELSGG